MTFEMASATRGLARKYGTVKWFGGHNNKTGRENNFGFIEDLSGKDIFLHKREWQGRSLPVEDEIVTYFEEESNGKLSAHRADCLRTASLSAVDLYAPLCTLPLNAAPQVQAAIEERLRESLCNAELEELRVLVHRSQQPGIPSIFSIVASDKNATQIFALLLKAGRLSIVDDAPWAAMSQDVATYFEIELAACLGELEPQSAREKCAGRLTILPSSLLTHLLTKNIFTTTDQLGIASARVYDYLSSVIIKGVAAFPKYLKASFDADIAMHCGNPSNPILRDIIDKLQFKKSLFEKTADFIDIYAGSARLHRNVETFILCNLFGLIAAANDHEVVYGIFMQRLWEALTAKGLPLEHRKAQLHSLFPPCTTMGPNLSCEAVHWPKRNLFLCRGRTCSSHKVLPDPDRHFMDFNIYEWLSHYGIDYMVSGKPQTKDFPIKLAGYFNRLQEILPVLHCRACADLLLPDMKYARTQYKELVQGVLAVKELAAAYRLTVFHCNNDQCDEFNHGHYISHCVGFGCHYIIDSRDLKHRCSHGRYICKGCGSCCSEHAGSHPVGLCGECGTDLEVWSEKVRGRQTTYSQKHVRCTSASCSFRIGPDNLPTKFSRILAKNEDQVVEAGQLV